MNENTAVMDNPVAATPAHRPCRQCGHQFRDHLSVARCRARHCDCSLFLSRLGSKEHAEVEAVMVVARTRDHFIHEIPDSHGMMKLPAPGAPAPIGMNCPDHPTYPLVIKDGQAWCRRGLHFWEV